MNQPNTWHEPKEVSKELSYGHSMHFSITAAFGGRLATLLKLAHQSQQPAATHVTSGCYLLLELG